MKIDYTSYANNDDMFDTIEDEQIPESNDVVEEIAELEEKQEDVIIKVANCEKVYVREEPSKDSDHLAVVSKGSELLIIGETVHENDELWHNVCTESGAEGYIMAKFTNNDSHIMV